MQCASSMESYKRGESSGPWVGTSAMISQTETWRYVWSDVVIRRAKNRDRLVEGRGKRE